MTLNDSKAAAAALMGTAVATALGALPLAAMAADAPTPAPTSPEAAASVASQAVAHPAVKTDVVEGVFAFDQGTPTSNAAIKQAFQGADQVLCGAQAAPAPSVPADEWQLSVTGDVQNQFTATLADLAVDGSTNVLMGCACSANGADQRQNANAEVTGITVMSLIGRAGVNPDANTVTFTTADGYSVALPLSYVKQRYSLIVYDVNGEPLQSSMGGTNQLWLGSTSARYFARDIVEVSFTCEDEVPPIPGTPEAGDRYANAPGIGFTTSEVA